MKIVRWDIVRESPVVWKWEGIGLRGNVVARSSVSFETRKACEDDMVSFKEEHKKIPCKLHKIEPKSFGKRFIEWIGEIWLVVRR